ncbi:MAG: PAS domain-containing protein [Thermonemataceae bacterium]|nr:PAS domain-containing protein [Thermonemataceae bacterium]
MKYYTLFDDIVPLIPTWLINSPSFYVIVTDLEGKYIFYNEKFAQKFYFLGDNLLGLSSANTVIEEDRHKVAESIAYILANPTETQRAVIRKPIDSKEGICTSTWDFSLLNNDKKEVIGIICIGYDLTESEINRQKAIEFDKKFDEVIDELGGGFFACDKNWICTKANKVIAELRNTTTEDLMGTSVWDILPNDDSLAYVRSYKEAMNERKIVQFEQFGPKTTNWFLVTAFPTTEGLNVFFRIITKEKEQEKNLKETEEKLKAILDSTPNAYIFVSKDLEILHFNQRAIFKINSLTKKRLKVGINFMELLPSFFKNTFQEDFKTALRGGMRIREVEFIPEWESTGIWLRFEIIPVYDREIVPSSDKTNDLIGVSINIINIDETKRSYDFIKKQNDKLKEIAFLQSHLLRKPVVDIKGLLMLISEEKANDCVISSPNLELYLNLLSEVNEDIDAIIHQIVAITNEIAQSKYI